MRIWKHIFGFLILLLAMIVIALFQIPDSRLHIVACDVGQGDGILVIYKNTQIVTDGGPDEKIIACLGKYMPFWDRKIELVVSTHPDSDHSTGLISLVKEYKVDNILINPIDSSTQTIEVLENMVGSRGVGVITPVEGMSMGLGLIRLDILNPSLSQIASLNEKIDGSSLNFYRPIDA